MANTKNELFHLFKRNFPFIRRADKTIFEILSDSENIIFEKCSIDGKLIGASVINKNTIYLLCVDKAYRCRGIGSELLRLSEEHIKECGYDSMNIGVGTDYLTPGVPIRTGFSAETSGEISIYPEVNDDAMNFFKKRGYTHSWGTADCFDMSADLSSVNFPKYSVGDTIDGVTYRWATVDDIPKITECTDRAYESFSKYYKNENCYDGDCHRVLIALDGDVVSGTLIVSIGTEGYGVGSVGCTTVHPKYRGRHIATNMVTLGTKYLQELGLSEGFLGYTYSGLEKMYGYAGYKICCYYFMAAKKLTLN